MLETGCTAPLMHGNHVIKENCFRLRNSVHFDIVALLNGSLSSLRRFILVIREKRACLR